jgi:hypothetical protein
MRVGIDESRHHHAPAGVDYFATAGDKRFDFATFADGLDSMRADEHRAVFNDCELAQIAAGARPPRARKRDKL